MSNIESWLSFLKEVSIAGQVLNANGHITLQQSQKRAISER